MQPTSPGAPTTPQAIPPPAAPHAPSAPRRPPSPGLTGPNINNPDLLWNALLPSRSFPRLFLAPYTRLSIISIPNRTHIIVTGAPLRAVLPHRNCIRSLRDPQPGPPESTLRSEPAAEAEVGHLVPTASAAAAKRKHSNGHAQKRARKNLRRA